MTHRISSFRRKAKLFEHMREMYIKKWNSMPCVRCIQGIEAAQAPCSSFLPGIMSLQIVQTNRVSLCRVLDCSILSNIYRVPRIWKPYLSIRSFQTEFKIRPDWKTRYICTKHFEQNRTALYKKQLMSETVYNAILNRFAHVKPLHNTFADEKDLQTLYSDFQRAKLELSGSGANEDWSFVILRNVFLFILYFQIIA